MTAEAANTLAMPRSHRGAVGYHLHRARPATVGLHLEADRAPAGTVRVLRRPGIEDPRRGVGAEARRQPREQSGMAGAGDPEQVSGAADRRRSGAVGGGIL